jgi:glycosyltransferase involved in cell wall biosynthesis
MRIVIDMQGAQSESRFRGIGRYSLSISQAIARNSGLHEVWLVANAQLPESIPQLRHAFNGLVPEDRIRIFDVPSSQCQGDWCSAAGELIREEFIAALAPDVVLVTSVFEGFRAKAVTSIGARRGGPKIAAILYDLIPLVNQEQYLNTKAMREYYFRKLECLKQAGLLLAISESSRQEGIKLLGIPADRIVDISTAVGPEFRPNVPSADAARSLRERVGITRNFVMYAPGGFDSRKNFARLIEAYSLLSTELRSQHQLLIVSRLHPAQREELTMLRDRFGLGIDELLLPGYVEDDDLIALYSLADLFVFPSLHEGFGLPVLEAMSCGAAVIGSNCTSIPEVIGLDVALFDPSSVSSIQSKLGQALSDESFRLHLREHGLSQTRRFSWDASARRAIAALESLQAVPLPDHTQEIVAETIINALACLSHVCPPDDSDLVAASYSLAFNLGAKKRQLLLDISSLVQSDAKSGIQRVVRSLLSEFLTDPPHDLDVQPIYFVDGAYRYAKIFAGSVTGCNTQNVDAPVNFCQGDIYLSLDLIMHLTPQVHGLHVELAARGIKLYFIVYDILLAQHPEWWPKGVDAQFNFWLRCISEVATGLLCISHAVAQELAGWLVSHPAQRIDSGPEIGSFHLGADVGNSIPSLGIPASSTAVLAQLKARKSLLMVSTIEPRKGYNQALEAFELLWERGLDINLVIVGKRGWLVEELVSRLSSHPERERRLFWLEGISDEYLELIYQHAHGLLAASEGEGFGLPLIEAALHKLPIIAREIAVFREVAGEHAFYFNGHKPMDLAEAIQTWLDLYQKNVHPLSLNMPWITWKESASHLMLAIALSEKQKSHHSFKSAI